MTFATDFTSFEIGIT